MMQVSVHVTDEVAYVVDVPPGAPAPVRVTLTFETDGEAGLRSVIEQLGGDQFPLNARSGCQIRSGVPMTVDGERVGSATLVAVVDPLLAAPAPEFPVVAAMLDERGVAGPHV